MIFALAYVLAFGVYEWQRKSFRNGRAVFLYVVFMGAGLLLCFCAAAHFLLPNPIDGLARLLGK